MQQKTPSLWRIALAPLLKHAGKLIWAGISIFIIGNILDHKLIYWGALFILYGIVLSIAGILLWLLNSGNIERLFKAYDTKILSRDTEQNDAIDKILIITTALLLLIIALDYTESIFRQNDQIFDHALQFAIHDDRVLQHTGAVTDFTYSIKISYARSDRFDQIYPNVSFGLIGKKGNTWINLVLKKKDENNYDLYKLTIEP